MAVIVTVVGADKVGIVAAVTTALAQRQVNIIDMSQTIMGGTFTMMLMAELPAATGFTSLKAELATLGDTIGVDIKLTRQEIFDAMHKL